MTRLLAQTEADVQRSILDWLRYKHFVVFRINAGAIRLEDAHGTERVFRSAPTGTPDIVACSPTGRFVAIEVKRPGAKRTVTKPQQQFLDAVTERGGIGILADTLDDVIQACGEREQK